MHAAAPVQETAARPPLGRAGLGVCSILHGLLTAAAGVVTGPAATDGQTPEAATPCHPGRTVGGWLTPAAGTPATDIPAAGIACNPASPENANKKARKQISRIDGTRRATARGDAPRQPCLASAALLAMCRLGLVLKVN
jgi:hypothetical protein